MAKKGTQKQGNSSQKTNNVDLKHLEAIINATNESILLVDPKGTILKCNSVAAKRLGKSQKKLVGLKIEEYLPKSLARERKAQADKIIRTKKPCTFQDERAGLIFENTLYPVFDNTGKLEAISIYSKDITILKTQALALEDYRDAVMSIIDNQFQFTGMLDTKGRVLMASISALKLLKIQLTDVIGRYFWDTPWWAHSVVEQKKLKAAISKAAKGEFVRFDTTHIDWKGKLHHVDFSLKAVRNSRGKISFLIPEGRDITDQKISEDNLRKNEERFNSMVAHSTDALFCYEYNPPIPLHFSIKKQVDLFYKGILVECNDIAAKSYGAKKAKQVIGKELAELFRTNPGSLDAFFKQFIKNGYKTENLESTEILKNGDKRYFLNNGFGVIENKKLLRVWGSFKDITNQRAFESAMRESELRFKSLFDNSLEGIGISQGNKVIAANKALLKMLGYSDYNEFIKIPLLEHIVPEDQSRIEQKMKRRADGDKSAFFFEHTCLRKDGKRRVLEISSVPIVIDNNQYTQSTFRDVTERKIAESALAESEYKFSRAFSAGPSMMSITRIHDGKIIDANDAFCRLTGYTKKDLINKTTLDLNIWADTKERDQFVTLLSKHGKVKNMEAKVFSKKGKINYALVSAEPIVVDNEKCVITIARDITERKKAMEELQKLAHVVQHSSELINLGSIDGKMIFLNEAGQKMLGISPSKVKDTHIMEVIAEQHKHTVTNELLPALIKGDSWEGELQYINQKTKKLIDVYANTFVVKDPVSKEPIFLANVSRDITDQIRTEEKLRKSHEHLQIFASRIQNIQELEKKNISRELHDQIGQNLTALNINLGLIKNSMSDECIKQLGKKMEDSMELLEVTTRSIRNIMGNLRPLILDDYGLSAAIRWYASQFQDRTGIKVYIKEPDHISRIDENTETALFRITQEALTNVSKHANATKVHVNLSKLKKTIKLNISDNGGGIIKKKIQEGGFGIINMEERAIAIGADFRISSRPGKGTKISITVER